jgi:uncharacterized protein (TIGR02271 family)
LPDALFLVEFAFDADFYACRFLSHITNSTSLHEQLFLMQRCERSMSFHVRSLFPSAIPMLAAMSDQAKPQENDALKVPVFEEELSVDIRTLDTGRGVRVHKTVVEQPVTVDELLMREHVDVRRVAVEQVLASGAALPAPRYEGDVLIVPVFEEVLVVEKRMKLKEELHITRTRIEESQPQTVVLKKERVTIERFDESNPLST